MACIGTVYCLTMFMNFNLEFSDKEMKVPKLHRVKREIRELILRSCSSASFFYVILLASL
jgi:hypothetical protein